MPAFCPSDSCPISFLLYLSFSSSLWLSFFTSLLCLLLLSQSPFLFPTFSHYLRVWCFRFFFLIKFLSSSTFSLFSSRLTFLLFFILSLSSFCWSSCGLFSGVFLHATLDSPFFLIFMDDSFNSREYG